MIKRADAERNKLRSLVLEHFESMQEAEKVLSHIAELMRDIVRNECPLVSDIPSAATVPMLDQVMIEFTHLEETYCE